MKTGSFRLKGRELKERYRPNVSLYQLNKELKASAAANGLAYGTLHRWTSDEDIINVQTDQLFTFLELLGLNRAEIAELRFSDVFEFLPDTEAVPE